MSNMPAKRWRAPTSSSRTRSTNSPNASTTRLNKRSAENGVSCMGAINTIDKQDEPLTENRRREGLHVLVVEDNEADAHLIERALRQQGTKVGEIERACDGVDALQRL